MFDDKDHYWIDHALTLAKRAEESGEVPVGAVVVLNDEIIGEGYNQPIQQNDPTAHAEIIALRAAAKKLDNYRLVNATLYVTLEPCAMCAGALLHARIKRLIYGAHDPKSGAITSNLGVLNSPPATHSVQWQHGLKNDLCLKILQDFFRARR